MKNTSLMLLVMIVIIFTNNLKAATFPTPVAATFYPLYNNDIGQYVVPTTDMPFDKISTLFIAFAHAYRTKSGALLSLENTQPDEDKRLKLVVQTARAVNPRIKFLISLGYGQNDWTYINDDYVKQANQFIPSVISFIRTFGLDGFDIFDQNINGSSGYIPQENFNAIIKDLKLALQTAGKKDNKNYYLTITPAYGIDNINSNNMSSFDLINTQNYTGSYPDIYTHMGYPAKQITQGLHIYYECDSSIPFDPAMAGMFSWNMTLDIMCQYFYTHKIAEVVGYP